MEIKQTFQTKLSQDELDYLSDCISMFTPYPDGLEWSVGEFLRKIGRGILWYGVDDNKLRDGYPIELTHGDLWMIREYAKTSVTVGTKKTGINLLNKAYEGIFFVEAGQESDISLFENAFIGDEDDDDNVEYQPFV